MFHASHSGEADVALIAMPWGSVSQPSLALGLLKALLARDGVVADVLNLNLLFAERIGLERYEATKNRNVMASEWVFAGELGDSPALDGYLDYLSGRGASAEECKLWASLRAATDGYLNACLAALPWHDYRVVGFTTSMMQTVSSLAFARRLKLAHPHLCIVFGGANCEGIMGEALHRAFPFVDVVVRGEPDRIVGELFRRLKCGGTPQGLAGVCYREAGQQVVGVAAEPFTALDLNPVPDYDEYFSQAGTVDFRERLDIMLMFESSRGCWWGERSHCTFCALNALGMKYRAKSVGRVVHELTTLRDRYGITNFGAADNIMDRGSVDELAAGLAESLPGIRVFYDIRASIERDQMRALHRAGIVELEAGLENLATPVLLRMAKATTGIMNVRFLRRCAEFKIGLLWNYLYGFPGECLDEYTAVVGAIDPWLFHLPPPDVAFSVSLQRYSPYHSAPGNYGIELEGPIDDYAYIYGVPADDLAELAYYFRFRYTTGYDPTSTGELCSRLVERWRAAYGPGRAALKATLDGEDVVIRDSRRGSPQTCRLDRAASLVYRMCESPIRSSQLAAGLLRLAPDAYLHARGGVDRVLGGLANRGLLFREDDRVLAIAVPDEESFWINPGAKAAPAKRRATLDVLA